jgi:hypothetical protein
VCGWTRAHAAKLHSKVGQEIVFGIRPEDVADTIFVSNPNPEHTIKAGWKWWSRWARRPTCT